MTTLNYNGKQLTLVQEAYLAGTNESPKYQAKATDIDGNDYLVTWLPYINYQELMAEDDESACCDWDDFYVEEI